ncbi:hypothetical protein D3C86_1795080 [compost metagenome]
MTRDTAYRLLIGEHAVHNGEVYLVYALLTHQVLNHLPGLVSVVVHFILNIQNSRTTGDEFIYYDVLVVLDVGVSLNHFVVL